MHARKTFAFLDEEAAARRTPRASSASANRSASGKATNLPASISSSRRRWFPLRVLDGSCVGVGDMEVVESGAGAAQAGLAGYLLLVDRRRELLWAVTDRGARCSPLGREQLPEGLPPGSLMGRGHQHAVDV